MSSKTRIKLMRGDAMRRISVCASLLLVFTATPSAVAESPVGTSINDFTLSDHLGTKHALDEWKDKRAVVVVFLGTECPLVKLYGGRLAELAERYRDESVQFVGINANSHDTLLEIGHYVRVHDIDFPMLKDAGNRVADQFGAKRTPEAFLLDEKRVVRYHGRIDDQYGVGYSRPKVEREDLAVAIKELLAGKPISKPEVEAVGCHIGRVNRSNPTGDITYSNQISRLLQKHCIRCHRPGQIAPFALHDYDEVVGWAETICEVMDDGRMPPWHASPKHGEFSNDARMTDDEKKVFYEWVENGLPRGDESQLPKPVEYDEDWQIGKPDVVFKMPKPFKVQAKGTVPYQYFYLDTKFEKDMWVQASEVRPGNRSVVHHIFLFYLPPGQEEPNAEDPLFNGVGAYAPGVPAGSAQDGMARFIPAGSRLGFQVHYTPTGTEQIDQSEVGLIFADEKEVTKEAHMQVAVNLDFTIPAQAKDHLVGAGYHFTQETYVHALAPHMHYRGRSFRFTANYPDGSQEILLDVPRYDFNWQNSYVLKKPKLMPEGTVMMCHGIFDNSAANLVNPDPTTEVKWGDQTWDEMMLGIMVTSLGPNVRKGEYPKIKRLPDKQFAVTFRYRPATPRERADAKTVTLAGSFNDWNKERHPMKGPDPDGYYLLTLNLKPGQHEYKFVINGEQWTHDPENPNRRGPFNNTVVRLRN
jgi:peroxiredoxin